MKSHVLSRLTVFVAILLIGGIGLAQEKVAPGASLRVELEAGAAGPPPVLQAGQEARLGFRVTDPHSDFPVSGLHPSAWVIRRDTQGRPDQAACEAAIRGQLGGLAGDRAQLDLNGFLILTLNADHTLGIINPQVNLNSANLEALIPLPGRPGGWALNEATGRVHITLPEQQELVSVDLGAHAIRSRTAVGRGAATVGLQPDGRYLWVGNDVDGTVTVVEAATGQAAATLPAGKGPLALGFDDAGRFAFAAASGEGRLFIYDARTLAPHATVEAGPGQLSLAYSPLAELLYVAAAEGLQIRAFRPAEGKEAATVELGRGITRLGISPDGRLLLALRSARDELHVVDVATHQLTAKLATGKAPDQIAFTPAFAYVRSTDTPEVTVVQLSGLLGNGSTPALAVPTGAVAPGAAALPGASSLAPLPEGAGGALIANPADRKIYFYMEGMAAPMNAFKTYTTPPLGILIHDRSLREASSSGRYETLIRLDEPGTYDVPFYLPSPRVATCFEITVQPGPGAPHVVRSGPPGFESLFADRHFAPGTPARLRFRLTRGDQPLALPREGAVAITTFRLDAHWSARAPARSLTEGIYEAVVTFPEAGRYHVLVEAPSAGIRLGDLRHAFAFVNERPQQSQEQQ